MTARPRPDLRRLMLGMLASVSLTLGACAFGPPPPDESGAPPNLPAASPSGTPGGAGGDPGTVDVVASHLATPWGIAFLPDGSALVTERTAAKILHVAPPETRDGLTVTTIATVIGVNTTGDGGLLGIAVSPQFGTDHTAYIYYSTRTDNRIGSVRLSIAAGGSASAPPSGAAPSGAPPSGAAPSGAAPSGGPPSGAPVPSLVAHPILTGIPHGATGNGGGLAFGPDHYLYASTGDAGHALASQDRNSLAGKILRMTAAGKATSGGPTAGSLIYAYGLHDVNGFDWNLDGRMYAMDAGPTEDALYHIDPGVNYGWGGHPSAAGKPVQTWPLATSLCPGIAVLDNVLVIACLTGDRAWVVQLTGRGIPFGAPVAALAGTYGRLRTVVVAPDGSLWLTTSNTDGHGDPGPTDDRIIKLVLSDAGAGKS